VLAHKRVHVVLAHVVCRDGQLVRDVVSSGEWLCS